MDTWNSAQYSTDHDLVEAVAATLALPRGPVDPDGIQQWRTGLAEQGWSVQSEQEDYYQLRHGPSGFQADLHLMSVAPEDLAQATDGTGGASEAHHAFHTVRLSDPEGTGLLADANLAGAAPDGTVTWLIARTNAATMDDTREPSATAAANPFRRSRLAALGDLVRRPVALAGAAGGGDQGMSGLGKALVAGAAGAVTTTLLHELSRRLTPDAPRVDMLGMQGLTHALQAAGLHAPAGRALYSLTLAGDLVSNAGYFGLIGAGPRDKAVAVGGALGAAAGLGAVYLPPRLGLSTLPTGRTNVTRAITVALYVAGGIAAGLTYRALSPDIR